MSELIKEIKQEFLNYLSTLYTLENSLNEAINYALLGGGKRIRPLLLLLLLEAKGKKWRDFLPLATALEMIHIYSLIHDDLPAMDNDDYRHGQLTLHKKYNEALAILAGDALLTDAFLSIFETELPLNQQVMIIKEVAISSGSMGMVYGQSLDMDLTNKDVNLDKITEIHYNKTGKLLILPFIIAAIICDAESIDVYRQVGEKLGLAFQIQDDILDITASIDELGKSANKDVRSNKNTYVKLFGLIKSQERVNVLYQEILDDLKKLDLLNDKDISIFINFLFKRDR